MMRTMTILLLWISVIALAHQQPCLCRNQGECISTHFSSECACKHTYIGKYCQTQAKQFSSTPQYVSIKQKFSYFVFSPENPNLFKFTFNVCMLANPEDMETLIFITSDQDDGSPSYEPSIFSSAKIKVKEGTCLVFSSPYIEIRKNVPEPFWRIIIGVRALPKSFKSYFYRTVPGKSHRQFSSQIIGSQLQTSQQFLQKLQVSMTFQLYKETLTESIIKIFVKVVVAIGISIAFYLFCRIFLFSYGIDTRDIVLCIHRSIRGFYRRIFPKGNQRSYRNYLHLRASGGKEEAELKGIDCAICLQQFEMEDFVEETPCRHVYHETCLQKWSSKNEKCPLCRKELKKCEYNWLKLSFRI